MTTPAALGQAVSQAHCAGHESECSNYDQHMDKILPLYPKFLSPKLGAVVAQTALGICQLSQPLVLLPESGMKTCLSM